MGFSKMLILFKNAHLVGTINRVGSTSEKLSLGLYKRIISASTAHSVVEININAFNGLQYYILCCKESFVIEPYRVFKNLILVFRQYGCLPDRLCGLVVRVSGYRYRGLGFDSRRYQIF